MRFVRFIGIEELDVLLTTGDVKPIKERRDCLYFFPSQGEKCKGWGCDYHSVPYRYEYVSGIVSDYHSDDGRRCIVLNLEMEEDDLEQDFATYANPEGSFWDTMSVLEYHSKHGYNIGDVLSVDIFKEPWGSFGLEHEKHFDSLHECKEWLNAIGIGDTDQTQGINRFINTFETVIKNLGNKE